jgi:hypothetical protein
MSEAQLGVWIPLLSALGGALIGALASIGTMYVQARSSDRRARAQMVLTMATEHYKLKQELGKHSGQPWVDLPLVTYVHYHAELLKLIERGELSTATLEALERANVELIVAIAEMDNSVRARAHQALATAKAKRKDSHG